MHKSNAFILVCAGVFLLALVSPLGATTAGAQADARVDAGPASPVGVVSPPHCDLPDSAMAGDTLRMRIKGLDNFPLFNVELTLKFLCPWYNPCSTSGCPGGVWDALLWQLHLWTDINGAAWTILSPDYVMPPCTMIVSAYADQIAVIPIKATLPKKYAFTICIDNTKLRHAFVRISDGTYEGTIFRGFRPLPDVELRSIVRIVPSRVADDKACYNTRRSEIEWDITEAQYNALIEEVSRQEVLAARDLLRFSLVPRLNPNAREWENCMSWARRLAETIQPPPFVRVPSDTTGGEWLPDVWQYHDPAALGERLVRIFHHQEEWTGGGRVMVFIEKALESRGDIAWSHSEGVERSALESVAGPAPSYSDVVETAIRTPELFVELYTPYLTLESQTLPTFVGETGHEVSYSNPVSCGDTSFVYWDFGDAYGGVAGTPVDSTNDQDVTHSFGAAGTYEGTLVTIKGTTLHHVSFTTVISDAGGGAEPPAVELALYGVRPNPVVDGALSVHFALPSGAAASLEVVDVSGRRIVEREVGSLGAGPHALDLGAGSHLAPGLYLVRLTQGASTRMTRVTVLE